jgi:predicted RNA binding protein YcfA (HicA-like mRNA interferase family)
MAFCEGPRCLKGVVADWRIKRQSGSHKTLAREGWADVVFAFHDGDEIGPRMLARLAKHTGLKPEDV